MDRISHIIQALTEEQTKALQLQDEYEKELATLPKGSIHSKKRNSVDYYYLSWAEEVTGNTVARFLSKDRSSLVGLQAQIDRRRYLVKELRQLKADLEIIERMLKPAQKRTQQINIRGDLAEMQKNPSQSAKQPPLANHDFPPRA